MANGTDFRVVPGGDESSESDDDGWGIGFMSQAQVRGDGGRAGAN